MTTRIVYRGARRVVAPSRSDLWAYKPSKAPLTQAELELAARVVSTADRLNAAPVAERPPTIIYEDSVTAPQYGWHLASLAMMAVIILMGFYAAAL